MHYQPNQDTSPSIKIQFSKVLFWGKREELQPIIMLMQREATQYVIREDADPDIFLALLKDLAIAKDAYYRPISMPEPIENFKDYVFSNN